MVNVKKNIESLERVVIDSFKIRIPFNRVEIISDELLKSWGRQNADTFEIKEEESTFQTMYQSINPKEYGDKLYSFKWEVQKVTIKKKRSVRSRSEK